MNVTFDFASTKQENETWLNKFQGCFTLQGASIVENINPGFWRWGNLNQVISRRVFVLIQISRFESVLHARYVWWIMSIYKHSFARLVPLKMLWRDCVGGFCEGWRCHTRTFPLMQMRLQKSATAWLIAKREAYVIRERKQNKRRDSNRLAKLTSCSYRFQLHCTGRYWVLIASGQC